MSRLRITSLAVALVALAACSSAEREKKEQEAAAAEKKLAESRAFREGLEREKGLLGKQLAETMAQTDAARTAYFRTLAAASFLAEREGSGLSLDTEMSAARSGFQLEEAARQKDGKAIDALVTALLDGERPCVPAPATQTQEDDAEPEEPEEACGPCEAPAYEDACVDIPRQLSQWPDWACDAVAREDAALPSAVFCRATFEHLAPASGEESPYAVEELPTEVAVVRAAFVHEGRLYASDWPAPSADLYHPRNSTGLAECAATTEQNACVHQCDVKFNRYEDPCACSERDHYDHDDMDDHDDSDAPEESSEVRAARRAAEAAEAAAEEARQRAEEAAEELSYRQCVAECEPSQPEPAPTEDADGNPLPPPPASAKQVARLEATPAPGVFVVTVETQMLAANGTALESSASTLLLESPGLVALWTGEEPPDADKLSGFEEVARFDEVLRQDGKVSLAPLPGRKEPALVGLSDGKVYAYGFSTVKGEAPVSVLTDAVCEAVESQSKRFPASFLEACRKQPPPAAGVDAGTQGPGAGEVTP
ncbi:hypothetical protein [Archangium sp.]|jgi:hypothetical protein|uniref:hypothetical protein n=1 Tax=Archangium sp. TaxID=1872627 RepID=UPI002ED812A2